MSHRRTPYGMLLVTLLASCHGAADAVETAAVGDSLSQLIREHDGLLENVSLDAICASIEQSDWLFSQLGQLEDQPLLRPDKLLSLEELPAQEKAILLLLRDQSAIPSHDYGFLPERLDGYTPLLALAEYCHYFTTMEQDIVSGLGHACLLLNERGRPWDQLTAFAIRNWIPQIPRSSDEAFFWVVARGLDSYAREAGYYHSSPAEREVYEELSDALVSGVANAADHRKWLILIRQIRQSSNPGEGADSLLTSSIFDEWYLQRLLSACGHSAE
jgi:hypothetical protein